MSRIFSVFLLFCLFGAANALAQSELKPDADKDQGVSESDENLLESFIFGPCHCCPDVYQGAPFAYCIVGQGNVATCYYLDLGSSSYFPGPTCTEGSAHAANQKETSRSPQIPEEKQAASGKTTLKTPPGDR